MAESDQAKKVSERLGVTGETVRANIKRIRESSRLTQSDLAEALARIGRSIPTIGVQRIESGTRRVDVDDLVALAVTLGVSPITLLMPIAEPDELLAVTGQPLETPAGYLWRWLRADNPLPSEDDSISNYVNGVERGGIPRFSADFLRRSLPPWEFAELKARWSVEERLDQHQAPDGDD